MVVQHAQLVRAFKASAVGSGRTAMFAFGFVAGFLALAALFATVASFAAVTVPMAGFLCMSAGFACGILFSRVFPFADAFTTRELIALERASTLSREMLASIEEQAAQMATDGVSSAKIAAQLGPRRAEAYEVLQSAIRAVASTPLGKRALGPGDPPKPSSTP